MKIFGMPWRTPRTASVNDEANRSRPSGHPVPLHSDGMPAVDARHQPSVHVVSSPPQGAGTNWSQTGVQKVTCRGLSVNVAGVERRPFADVFFRLHCSRSTGQRPTVELTVDQADFGVENCCTQNCPTNQSCHKNCETVFIRKMTFEVRPKSWAQGIHRLRVQPQHTPEVIAEQRNSNRGCQIPFCNPRQASITYQTGNAVSHSSPAFGWSPGHKDVRTNSVSWTWELHRFPNGRKLKLNKHRWGSRPLLGISPSYTHIRPGEFPPPVGATWELEIQPNRDLQQLRLECDVRVTLETAVFRSTGRLPGYSVAMVPTTMTYDGVLYFP